MEALAPPTLAEQIDAATAALSWARETGRPIAAHEAILRGLIEEARKTGPLGRALALADVTGASAGPLRPFQVEAFRPQAEFNRALVEVLPAVLGVVGGDRSWVERRLTPLADPTAWRVKSHRAGVAGRVVDATKRAAVIAMGPALRKALEAQRAWNQAVVAFLVHGKRDLPARSRGPAGFDAVFARQERFNLHLESMLAASRPGEPVELHSGLSSERAGYVRRVQEMARTYDCAPSAFERKAPAQGPVRSITWFLPHFNHPFGGVHTIFRFADAWRRAHGVENRFVVYDHPHVTARELEAKVALILPEPPGTFEVLKGKEALPASDLAIATLWSSVYPLMRLSGGARRAYFIQDYEPLFYAAGTVSALAANSYDLGFFGIFNTRGLYESVRTQHAIDGVWFEPAVDTTVFHPRGRTAGNPRVFFYGRPSVDRNGFELGVEALRKLKAQLPEVDIVSAGEPWEPAAFGLDGVVKNLGVLPYAETANLYRSADVGLVFMFTRHPSYLPLEMMACGTTVITNQNPANAWLLEHRKNCLLAVPTATGVAELLIEACRDAGLRARLSKAGAERMAGTSWDAQTEKVWAAVCDLLE